MTEALLARPGGPRLVPYRPDDGSLAHPPYIGQLYRSYLAAKAGSGRDR